MQLNFIFPPPGGSVPGTQLLAIGSLQVPLLFVRHRRARRYVLRVRPDGVARVTIPRGGSPVEARRFVERHRDWIEQQLQRRSLQAMRPKGWFAGGTLLLRGESLPIRLVSSEGRIVAQVGEHRVRVENADGDLRPALEAHLWALAKDELPRRVLALAERHGLVVRQIRVRNQRSRWGSCSRRGTISLNWRLIQAPAFVGDYIVLHELMHLREMNHSARFWKAVAAVCPDYETAEQWLKRNGELLR